MLCHNNRTILITNAYRCFTEFVRRLLLLMRRDSYSNIFIFFLQVNKINILILIIFFFFWNKILIFVLFDLLSRYLFVLNIKIFSKSLVWHSTGFYLVIAAFRVRPGRRTEKYTNCTYGTRITRRGLIHGRTVILFISLKSLNVHNYKKNECKLKITREKTNQRTVNFFTFNKTTIIL